MYRDFQDLLQFSRKYQQFQRISSLALGLLDREHDLSEDARAALMKLNSDRVACQEKIAALGLSSIARCENCATGCCGKPSDHYFTVIDFWLRKYTQQQISGFSQAPLKPLHHYYKSRLASALQGGQSRRSAAQSKTGGNETRCSHLGDDGCTLPHAERPLKCLIYACPDLKRSMDDVTRAGYMEAVRELHRISLETFNVLKAEAGLPPSYGLTSLLLTL